MKTTTYIGVFKSAEGHVYSLDCNCFGVMQALIILTAKAIQKGFHYQLETITDEREKVYIIGDILKINEIITPKK